MEVAYSQILKRVDLKGEAVKVIAQAPQNHGNQKARMCQQTKCTPGSAFPSPGMVQTAPGRGTPPSALQHILLCPCSPGFVRLHLSQRVSQCWWNQVSWNSSPHLCLHTPKSNDQHTRSLLFRAIPTWGWGTVRQQCKTNLISHWHVNKKLPEAGKTANCRRWEHHSGIQRPGKSSTAFTGTASVQLIFSSVLHKPDQWRNLTPPQLKCTWGVTTNNCIRSISSSVSPVQIIQVSLPERIFQDIPGKRLTLSVPQVRTNPTQQFWPCADNPQTQIYMFHYITKHTETKNLFFSENLTSQISLKVTFRAGNFIFS